MPAPRRERSELGKALDERRAALGYQTIEALAQAAGVSPKTVSNLLNGSTRKREHVLLPLNRAFRFPPGLLGRALTGEVTPAQIRAMPADATGPVFADALTTELAARGVQVPDPGILVEPAGVLNALAIGAPDPGVLRLAASVLAAVGDMLTPAPDVTLAGPPAGVEGILAGLPGLTDYDKAAIAASVRTTGTPPAPGRVTARASGLPGHP
jgi:transcriptional regulator with XRE-family HTH domain